MTGYDINVAAVGGLAVIIGFFLLQLFFRAGSLSQSFRNDRGERLKVFPKDTRVMRFTLGTFLSDAGKALSGSDPYLVRNGSMTELVIFAPEHLQEFHRKDAKRHFKPPNMNMGNYAGQLLGQCVGQQSGDKWKTMRSYFDPEFSRRSSISMMPQLSQVINQWANTLITRGSTVGEAVTMNITPCCKLLALRSISIAIYGDALDHKETLSTLDRLNGLHTEIMTVAFLSKRASQWWYNTLPTPEKRLMSSFQHQWREFNLTAIAHARKNGIFCPAERIYTGVEAGDMTLPEFLQTVDEMLFTNIDITGMVLTSVIHNMAKNQRFRNSLVNEMSTEKARPGYTLLDYIGRQDTFLHFTISESIRVTPPTIFSLPECNESPKCIAGYRIPARTPTIIDIRRLHASQDVWGPDAEVFRPERFAELDPIKYRFGFVRWGIGRDKCLGKNMADAVLKLAVMAVLDRYFISMAPEIWNPNETSGAGFTAEHTRDVLLERLS